MGSLMAGWDSHVIDRSTDKYKKNWSFTKGEVEAFWKSKKKIEEEHLKAISSSQESTPEAELLVKKHKRSSSLPLDNTKEDFTEEENELSLENLIKSHGWWTKSNWAFLNEPPVLADLSPNTYASQLHVANVGGGDKKYEANSQGISA